LEDVPVLDHLAVVVEPPDVDAGHVERLVVRVGGDEVAFRDRSAIAPPAYSS